MKVERQMGRFASACSSEESAGYATASLPGLLRRRLSHGFSGGRARQVLVWCVSIDLSFIAFHLILALARYFGLMPIELPDVLKYFSIINDRGLPEFFNNLKTLLAAIFLFATWARSRQAVYLCWALVFLTAVLDDGFLIHERVGEAIYRGFFSGCLGSGWIFLGQLVMGAAYALIFGTALLVAHASAEDHHAANSYVILLVLLVVVFFAFFVDGLHGLLRALQPGLGHTPVFQGLFNVLEDGGEMISLSVALSVIIAIQREPLLAPTARGA